MRKLLLLVILCAGFLATVVCRAEIVPIFKDDFSVYKDGSDASQNWECVQGKWVVKNKKYNIDSENPAFCYAFKTPEMDSFEFTAKLVVSERLLTSGWSVVGINVFLDAGNFWRLAFVEGPDKKRYVEMVEMFQSKWQAQTEGISKLKQTVLENQYAGWEYGKEYKMRIVFNAKEITGEIIDPGTNKVISKIGYLWEGAGGVKFGRPGLSATGFSASFSDIAVNSSGQEIAAGPSVKVEEGKEGRVAILKDEIPGIDVALVENLSSALRKAGFGVTAINCDHLVSPSALSVRNFDVIVFTNSPYFPVEAKDSLLRFLRNSGGVVLLGGHPFSNPLWKFEGKWLSKTQIENTISSIKPQNMIFDFEDGDLSGWVRSTNAEQSGSNLESEQGKVGKCMRMSIKGLNGWDTFNKNFAEGLPSGQTLVCFWAKGDNNTPDMAVEIDEKDGSRWIAVVELKTEWRHYVLTPERFLFWKDSPTKDRGGSGDCLNPENASKISFGLAFSHTKQIKGDHTLWVDEVGTASSKFPKINFAESNVSLNIFSDYEPYNLKQIEYAEVSGTQEIISTKTRIKGPFEGFMAVGFAFPNESKLVSIMDAFDGYGRNKGPAAGLLINYAGSYRSSCWLFSGLTNRSFYSDPAFVQVFIDVLKAMKSGNLPQKAKDENLKSKITEVNVTTPAPAGFIRISPDGKHLVYPDGRRFFMIGCNYVGSFDRCGGRLWRDDYFDARYVEDDFRKARDAGLNIIRYWVSTIDKDIMKGDFRKVNAIKEYARKYGVYLLIDLPGTGYSTVEEMVASHKAIASAFKDEPMVLGYDLRNEPYVTTLGGIIYKEKKPPVQTVDLSQKYSDKVKIEQIQSWVKERPWWLHLPSWIKGEEAERVVTAWYLWEKYTKEFDLGNSIKGIKDKLPVSDAWKDLIDVVDESLKLWEKIQIDAIREVDKNHLITVGHNTPLQCLPSNQQLDFVSKHVYIRPFSHESVMENITTLDRLAKLWPDKPITFGEFGYTNGIPMKEGYLDFYTSAVGETIHFLYALANGYDGCKKWMLVDWPLEIMKHYGDWDRGLETRIYEERFGLYWYDGTIGGRPKPIVWSLKFLRDYVDKMGPGGTLEVKPGKLSIGAVYIYKGKNALFVGNIEYKADNIEFKAKNPANVMLDWNDGVLKIMSSADATVKLNPAKFLASVSAPGAKIEGKYGSLKKDGDCLIIEMLEGETIKIM